MTTFVFRDDPYVTTLSANVTGVTPAGGMCSTAPSFVRPPAANPLTPVASTGKPVR
jgi:hypothetical protein